MIYVGKIINKMTYIRKENLEKLLQECLKEPGNYLCNVYRTDGITQNNILEQLFANYYLNNKYTYETTTNQARELELLNEEVSSNGNAFAKHLAQFHNKTYKNVSDFISSDCSSDCIATVLKIIHSQLVEYSNTIKMSMLSLEKNNEICEAINKEYQKFMNFVIVMENRLPELSKQISTIKSTGFPFSLWKFLHQEFIGLIINPMLPQLLDGACEMLEKNRMNSLEQILKGTVQKRIVSNEIFEVKAISQMIAYTLLTEVTVHFLESTKSESSIEMEDRLAYQTQKLYKEYGPKFRGKKNVKEAMRRDRILVEKALMPSLAFKVIEECRRNTNLYFETDQGEAKNEGATIGDFYFRDIEVEGYTSKLGLDVTVNS